MTITAAGLKRRCRSARVTYDEIRLQADVSYHMVWLVMNGRRKSLRIMKIAEAMVRERRKSRGVSNGR
jgi:hypothetical protein